MWAASISSWSRQRWDSASSSSGVSIGNLRISWRYRERLPSGATLMTAEAKGRLLSSERLRPYPYGAGARPVSDWDKSGCGRDHHVPETRPIAATASLDEPTGAMHPSRRQEIEYRTALVLSRNLPYPSPPLARDGLALSRCNLPLSRAHGEAGNGRQVEVRAGIEPTFADLQSAASPLCHRTVLGRRRYIEVGPAAWFIKRPRRPGQARVGVPGARHL